MAVIAYFGSRFLLQENRLKAISKVPPSYRLAIGGLAFYGTSGGQKSIAIRADRFVIEKKKFGFLSFSLMNVARLENAVINVYGIRAGTSRPPASGKPMREDAPDTPKTMNPGTQAGSSGTPAAAGPGPSRTQTGGPLTFDHVLSRESFSLFPAKNIGAIEAAPIVVQFHDDQGVFTRLDASSGTVRLKQQDILFSGNVRVTSGGLELQAGQLMFLPQQGIFKAEEGYTLKNGEGRRQGKKLTTDIHLKTKRP
jgi:hypothetical protein